jgi:2-hydroxychromene-2-carboxylate isomerase
VAEGPVFYYDLGSPACYLAAERIVAAPPGGARVVAFEPVLAAGLRLEPSATDRAAIERRAVDLGLMPVRWPARWPPATRAAMLAATYAKQIGRTVAFSLAAFRQEFAAGRDLEDEDTLLLAGAACEIHPGALLRAISLRSVRRELERATERARAAGVRRLPALALTDEVRQGEEVLDR